MKTVFTTVFTAGAMSLLLTAVPASAQLMVNGVGSSAQYQAAALAAYQLAGAGAAHYTASSGATTPFEIIDTRDPAIVNQSGTIAVVWNSAQTKVWSYLSVDSVVGNRAYFAQPRASLRLPATLPAAGQKIDAAYWGLDAATIPPAVVTLINNQKFTAAFTDILPADAKFAQNRVNCGTPSTATIPCLGYTTADANVGLPIKSAFSTTTTQPVNFNVFGTDPITGNPIPNYTVVPVGISPVILIDNRTNASGLGQAGYTDAKYQATVQLLFTGTDCDGTAFGSFAAADQFAINPILREPLSGTMNTFEYNFMIQNQQGDVSKGYFSQESIFNPPYTVPTSFGAVQPATNNPLNGACPGGSSYAVGPQGARKRAIGTGEVVTAVMSTGDSIGYIFFGYGNVSPIKANPKYGYLTYQSVDPINPSGSYATAYNAMGISFPGNGQLPTCTAPCKIPAGKSFPNIRNGAYREWSLLRAVADAGSASLTNLQALATVEANQINGQQPDFLPFNPTSDGDPGFVGYRSHFVPGMTGTPPFNFNATNTPNNGITNPALEAGGDVGGCLQYKTDPTLLNCRY